MNLKKALFYKSKKRIGLLFSMLVFVMFALYLSLSLHFSKYRIQDTLKQRNLPQTIFVYDKQIEDEMGSIGDWDVQSLKIKDFAQEKGYSYTDMPTMSDDQLRLESYANDNYRVIDGKELEFLEDFEIAISKEYANTLGENIIGQTINFLNIDLVVQSIIEYPNYELAYQPLETLSQTDLFEEGMLGSGITTEDTIYAIRDNFYKEDIDAYAFIDHPEYMILKINYDDFTFDKERELINHVAAVEMWSGSFDNVYTIHSLAILTQSNPLVEMLKSSISKFVVSMIVLSSTYAFYIHLKNELHSKRKTLATLNILGVSFKEVVKTYVVFFIKLFAGGYVSTTLITYALGYFKPNFKPNRHLLFYLFALSLLFMFIIFMIFLCNLFTIRKRSFEEVKVGGLSFVKIKPMNQKRLVKNLALKRFTKTINLTLGFALSLGLSIAVVLISLSALNSVGGVYHPETLGLN
ncbi:MAG TPA: FtsX-like permease family protein, partial [Erysipelothrix sp.]|nr:FtsX-like permease family protein [Erysipelothrix sp.]